MKVRPLVCWCGATACRAHSPAGCVAKCDRCGKTTPADENVAGFVWCSGCLDYWRRWMS